MIRIRSRSAAERANSSDLLTKASRDVDTPQIGLLHRREKIARLLQLFGSARRRPGLTSDEILIFFAIGYLGTSISKNLIQMRPISYADVALLLGIPKETVRRKAVRLVDIDYVVSTSKGIFINQLETWCQMLDRAV